MNTVTLMGRLSQDPEIRSTSAGKTVYNFNFAVNRRFVRTEGDPKADFFSCVAFGTTAERLEKCRLTKGVKLLIQGELQNDSWQDKQGNKRITTRIIVNDFDFCESKGVTAAETTTPRRETATKKPVAEIPEDFMQMDDGIGEELPFV